MECGKMHRSMNIQKQTLIPIKTLKHFTMFYDLTNSQVLIKRQDFLTIEKNEIFPVMRGLVSAIQRFYRKHAK